MTTDVFLIVLAAAAFHAGWNALVKSVDDKTVSITAITLGHMPLSLVAVALLPPPARESWALLAGSVALHIAYQVALMNAYRLGEFTQVYPIARGTGPALVTLISALALGVVFSSVHIAAIAAVVAGIISLAFMRGTDGLTNPQAVGAALITGVFIAGYSLVDGLGARESGSAVAYVAWLMVFNGLFFAIGVGLWRPTALKGVFTTRGGLTSYFLGGSASMLAYMLAVWAMTKAPIALVTALRETSTIFALLIGVVVFRERVTLIKVCATLLVLGGVVAMRAG